MVHGLRESWNVCYHSVVKCQEVNKTVAMVDYVMKMNEKSQVSMATVDRFNICSS